MNRYKWTPMFSFLVCWSDCLKARAGRHTGERVTGSITIYISNGDSIFGNCLLVHFIDILAVWKIFPFCDTYYKVCSFNYIMVNTCVVQGCVVGTAKQNVTLHEFPKDRAWHSLCYGGVSYRRREATEPTPCSHVCSQHFVSHDFVNNVEYQMGYAKKREDQQDGCPDNFSIETVWFTTRSSPGSRLKK